jgi:hypothetical protein
MGELAIRRDHCKRQAKWLAKLTPEQRARRQEGIRARARLRYQQKKKEAMAAE